MKFTNPRDRVVKISPGLAIEPKKEAHMNPPVYVADRFTPKHREILPPVKVPSPAKSAIRGDVKVQPVYTLEDVMALLMAQKK